MKCLSKNYFSLQWDVTNELDCVGVCDQNSTVNRIRVDDWTAELGIIFSIDNALFRSIIRPPYGSDCRDIRLVCRVKCAFNG